MKKLSKSDVLNRIHKDLDHLDEYVALGVITREELTDEILRRHLLSAKHALRYFCKNAKAKILWHKKTGTTIENYETPRE